MGPRRWLRVVISDVKEIGGNGRIWGGYAFIMFLHFDCLSMLSMLSTKCWDVVQANKMKAGVVHMRCNHEALSDDCQILPC